MTEMKPAGETAAAEKPKDDYILESNVPEVKATETEPAKAEPAKEPQKTDDADETDKDTDTGEGKKRRGGYQRKLDAKDAEIARLNAKLAEGGNAGEKAPEKAADDAKEPKPEDFPTWGEYTKALVKHEAKQEAKAAKEESAKDQAKAEAQKSSMTKVEKYKAQVTEARKAYKDFDEVLNEYDGPSSPELHAAILDSDQGAEVAYYLANNPEEAEKMRGMDTGDLYRFIGKIEAKLEHGKSEEPPPVKTSKAPKPVEPVGKGKADVEPDWDNMDPDEYIRRRRERRNR